MSSPHIVTAFENELIQLTRSLVTMGHVVSAQFQRALAALRERDSTLADAVICDDSAVDAAQTAVDETVVSLLALRQPVADDLRLILVTSKVAGRLERIGDIAANTGKRTKVINALPPVALTRQAIALGDIAYGILADAMASFSERDVALAQRVRERDYQLDASFTAFNRDLVAHMTAVTGDVLQSAHLLFIGKNMERVGDHATNIAEVTIYLTTGLWPAEQRRKNDLSSSLEESF